MGCATRFTSTETQWPTRPFSSAATADKSQAQPEREVDAWLAASDLTVQGVGDPAGLGRGVIEVGVLLSHDDQGGGLALPEADFGGGVRETRGSGEGSGVARTAEAGDDRLEVGVVVLRCATCVQPRQVGPQGRCGPGRR
jgi:hypothetical protein